MLVESLGYYKIKEPFSHSSLELELNDFQVNALLATLIFYVIITIYVSIKYPIGGNVFLSVILAIFFSTVFWIVKLIEIAFGGFEMQKQKRRKDKKSRKSYYKPIY